MPKNMEVKKKYCLIAFCAIILLAFICAPLGIRSRKVNDKDIERMYELYNQLVDERPDTFALAYAVEPAFIRKYNRLTEANFNAFVNDWKEWSIELRSFSSDSLVNEAIGRIYSIYSKSDHTDSSRFFSLPSNIAVSIYPYKLKDCTKKNAPNLESIIKDAKHYACYIPEFDADKNIVYITPEIDKLLSFYIGGVSESGRYRYEAPFTPVNEGRLSELRQIIPVVYGHWGGYWHFESMPIIFRLFMFQDGFITELRKSWCESDSIFVPYDIKEEPVILSYWIE